MACPLVLRKETAAVVDLMHRYRGEHFLWMFFYSEVIPSACVATYYIEDANHCLDSRAPSILCSYIKNDIMLYPMLSFHHSVSIVLNVFYRQHESLLFVVYAAYQL